MTEVEIHVGEVVTRRGKPSKTLRGIGPTLACELALRRLCGKLLRAAAVRIRDHGIPAALATSKVIDGMIQDAPTGVGWFIEQLRRSLNGRSPELEAAIRNIFRDEELRHRRDFTAAVRASYSIDLSPVLAANDVRQHLELATERTLSLMQGMTDDLVRRTSQTLIQGVVQGQRHTEVAKEIAADLGFSQRRARLIARNETATLNGTLNRVRQQQAGVTRYEWSTSLDERVRPLHAEREGRVFRWDRPPSDGHPGEPINCRCVARAIIE